MATRNGARALGQDVGELVVGKRADIVLLDLNDPVFTPLVPGNRNQLFSHLGFAASGSAVHSVLIDGRIVMQERQILTVDEEVLREANRAFIRSLDTSGIGG
jgi:5-methylthioadenosine/S-adenosylhomocysteine deaminase